MAGIELVLIRKRSGTIAATTAYPGVNRLDTLGPSALHESQRVVRSHDVLRVSTSGGLRSTAQGATWPTAAEATGL